MPSSFVIGEDALCCALGSKLVREVLRWDVALPVINTKGVTKLRPAIPRYLPLSRVSPVLCIADTDGGCAMVMVQQWMSAQVAQNFLLRFAVAESESWVLADSEALALYFEVSVDRLPRCPDDEADAKRTLLKLASRSKRRDIRMEMVSTEDPSRPGVGYNAHLSDFISLYWRPREAAVRSPSLARAVRRLEQLRSANQ